MPDAEDEYDAGQRVTIDDLSRTMRQNLLSILDVHPTPHGDIHLAQAQALERRGLVTIGEGGEVGLTDTGHRMAAALRAAPLSARK